MAHWISSLMQRLMARVTPKQSQYLALAALLVCGIGALWIVFAFTSHSPNVALSVPGLSRDASGPTNIGVMAPGQQVSPLDQWVGTAGRKLAQYEQERDEQSRVNRERKEFEEKTLQRFHELEQRLTTPAAAPPIDKPGTPGGVPPAEILPPVPPAPAKPPIMPPLSSTTPSNPDAGEPLGLTHVTVSAAPASARISTAPGRNAQAESVGSYLPVSFVRGVLLGGLDAPTGGQAQSNPHPVLIRLSDDAVLPNRFRGQYRDCFVIAAGYGDIGSERAYLRTETLSCVRDDGATLDVPIQGSIYGEDGKNGMRGRLVTKQGQMLANALLAGIAGGIGQGLSTSAGTYSSSALGTIANTSGNEALHAGLGSGVGRALDRLAQYYIRLAEQTFPVIEIDAGREIDVVITKGVRIDGAPDKPSAVAVARAGVDNAGPPGDTHEDD